MWQFVFLNIFLISLGVLLFLVIRLLPRMDNKPVSRGFFERWLTSEIPERFDHFLHALYVRTLRRVKVMVLKTDNALTRKMESMRLESGEPIAGSRPDLSAITSKTPEEIGEETGAE
jgi:hypothetical protein